MAEVASAYVTLLPSAKGFGRGIQGEIGGDLSRAGRQGGTDFGSGMKSGVAGIATKIFAPLAIAAAGLGLGKILSDSVTAGSDLQQSLGGAEAVFKKSFGSIEKSATGAATALGLSKSEYLELVTVLGAGLKNKGLKDYAKQSQNLVSIGADLAAQYGGSTKEAVDALASAMRGEMDPIERYGIALSQTALKGEAARLGLAKRAKDTNKIKAADLSAGVALTKYNEAVKEYGSYSKQALSAEAALIRSKGALAKAVAGDKVDLTDNAKAQAALSLVMRQSADAQGAFARESDTYAGSQARLKATWENMKAQLGTALLPALTDVSQWFLNKGLPAVKEYAKGFKAVSDLIFKGDFAGASKTFGFAEDSKQIDFLFKLRDGAVKALDVLKRFGSYVKDDLWPAIMDGWKTVQPGLKQAGEIIKSAFGGESGATVKDFATFVTGMLIPGIAKFVNVWLPVMATQLKGTVKAIEGVYNIFKTVLDIQAKVASAIIGTFIRVANLGTSMLEALSTVPGFDWAADAADKLRELSGTAAGVKAAIDRIPDSKTVAITAKVTMPGRIALPDGSKVNVGLRAAGGPVKAGAPYIVGEKGPELIVPKYHGNVIPNHDLGSGKGLPSASSGIDYYRLADVMSDAMRQTPLAVGVSETTTAVNRRNAVRARG